MKMIRSSTWVATLLGIVVLLGAGSLAARTGKTLAANQISTAAPLISVQFAVPSSAAAVWASAMYTGGDDGYQGSDKDKYGDHDGDKDDHDHDHDHHHHEPTPEPSTLLSFGAAILIGGGVLLSRRMRRSK